MNRAMRVIGVVLMILLAGYQPVKAQQSVRINQGWLFLREDLGGIWEAVRPGKEGSPESVPLWAG
ncbi:hypothetical protein KRR40_46840 [Niabella defluvii]|nr:hypothetical protein KRR40_46840 [Niabella sp. I65]